MERRDTSVKNLSILVLGALGVVYGDLGTSPLYALRECFEDSYGLEPIEINVLGVLSLIFWALTVVISLKYMVFVLRADNGGEGGILALKALALSRLGAEKRVVRALVTALGLFGAALLYGDGMITPAISVLSAIEGLEVATPAFRSYVLPVTIAVLMLLFVVQKHGTAKIGAVFGPVILLWFGVLGVLGIRSIIDHPQVLWAVNPAHGVRFFLENRFEGFFVLGAVFLALTGGEALYADMGHFGRRPIQIGWYFVALPGLLLNYFGQGALLLSTSERVTNPFYALVPQWGLLPMVALSTIATVIASQAIISGVFSLTRQAVLLGYLPRVRIVHTSSLRIGQIYIPTANGVLLVATIGLVLIFRSSSGLAAAYGVAVAMTMLITTLLLYVVARHVWDWRRRTALSLLTGFLLVDLCFCSSAFAKIPSGGWFPLVIALGVYILMSTWRKGRQILASRLYKSTVPLNELVESISRSGAVRAPGAAIFMSANPTGAPSVLLHNIKYNRIVHETVAVMAVTIKEAAHVSPAERVRLESLGQGFYRIEARYGFMESPNVQEVLDLCAEKGLELRSPNTGFFLGHENILITRTPGMARWRQRLFALMSRNAQGASPFYEIPPNQVVELGVQVQL